MVAVRHIPVSKGRCGFPPPFLISPPKARPSKSTSSLPCSFPSRLPQTNLITLVDLFNFDVPILQSNPPLVAPVWYVSQFPIHPLPFRSGFYSLATNSCPFFHRSNSFPHALLTTILARLPPPPPPFPISLPHGSPPFLLPPRIIFKICPQLAANPLFFFKPKPLDQKCLASPAFPNKRGAFFFVPPPPSFVLTLLRDLDC